MKLLTDLISFFLAIIGLAMICIAVGLVVVYDAISYLTSSALRSGGILTTKVK